jgi:hypothetical protein
LNLFYQTAEPVIGKNRKKVGKKREKSRKKTGKNYKTDSRLIVKPPNTTSFKVIKSLGL